MYTHYRRKTGGLCYKVLAFGVMPFNVTENNPFPFRRDVVIQHLNGTAYTLPEKEFWEMFEGVEPDELPPAYKHEASK